MEADIIEPEPELQLIIVPAPDDPALFSKEYQKVLFEFFQALKAEGLEVSGRSFTFDAVGAVGGLSGEFVIASIVALTPVINAVQKLIETLIDARDGRKLKLQIGSSVRMEGSARDVEKMFERLVSSEPFQKLLESETSKKKPHRLK